MAKPIIGVTTDSMIRGPHLYYYGGDKYSRAIIDCMGAVPLMIPAIPAIQDDVLDVIDGLLVTGGYSNIQRQRYGLDPAPEGELEDPIRDAQDLSMIPKAIDRGIPFLGICRGMQALNVVMGGSLFPRVHEVEGRFDHRENPDDPVEKQFGPAHNVRLTEGGQLHKIIAADQITVNSVHGQAIDRVAEGLTIEAIADDTTVEALSVQQAKSFALAVQWHPEFDAKNNPDSVKIYDAFNRSILKNINAK